MTPSQVPPDPRHLEEITYDPDRNTLLLFGGGGNVIGKGSVFPDPVCEWDGLQWKEYYIPGPFNRFGHAIVYDNIEKASFLIGGINQSTRTVALDVWKWDGKSWQFVSSECPAKTMEACYDPINGRVLIYGDVYNKTELRQQHDPLAFELWKFKNNNWKKLSSSGPQIESQFEIGFDIERKSLVIPVWDHGKSVVWEWKNEAWHSISAQSKSPVERNRFALAYHANVNGIFLFGGRNNEHPFLNDFWKWDGEKWTQILSKANPSARAAALMEYGNDGLYLYGGVTTWGLTNEIWKWDHENWRLLNGAYAMDEKRTSLVLKQRLTDHPNDVEGLTNYGMLLGRQNQYKLAIPYLKKVQSINEADHNILISLCDMLYKQGNTKGAEFMIITATHRGKMPRNSY